MSKYKIIYIDEEESEADKFKRRFENDFEIIYFSPKEDVFFFTESLLSYDPDAIVIDFQLNVAPGVTYNGTDLFDAIFDTREKFPCFILTSHTVPAAQSSKDVNYIYSKKVLNPGYVDEVISFEERVKLQIEHYRKMINEINERFSDLLKKSENELTKEEENELLKLDTEIEELLNKKNSIPNDRKKTITLGKIETLITKSEEILSYLKNEEKE